MHLNKQNQPRSVGVIYASFLEEVVSCLCRVEDDDRLGEEGHMDHVPCKVIVECLPRIEKMHID
jgi:hypothetical protein